MSIFSTIADGFVQAFGITAPAPGQRKKATLFICTLVLGILLCFLGAAAFLILHFAR
jgi:hypothetical protein